MKHEDDTPLTVGERDKFYRKTVRPLILGDNWVVGDPAYFRWDGFLAACKNTAVIPLLAELPELDQLADKGPPLAGYQPEDATHPPFELEENDGAGVDKFEYTNFTFNKLIPWFEWANSPQGPCSEFVTIEDSS